jgi:hypothetical protein
VWVKQTYRNMIRRKGEYGEMAKRGGEMEKEN